MLFLGGSLKEQYIPALKIHLTLNLSRIVAQIFSSCQHAEALHRQWKSRDEALLYNKYLLNTFILFL